MKYLIFIIASFLPMKTGAVDKFESSQLPDLDELTKNSMKRTANITINPNGQFSLDTSNSFRSVTFVRIGEDGKNEIFCTANEIEARKFLAGKKITLNSEGE